MKAKSSIKISVKYYLNNEIMKIESEISVKPAASAASAGSEKRSGVKCGESWRAKSYQRVKPGGSGMAASAAQPRHGIMDLKLTSCRQLAISAETPLCAAAAWRQDGRIDELIH